MGKNRGIVKILLFWLFYIVVFIGLQFITIKILHIDKNISRIIYYILMIAILFVFLKKAQMTYILRFDKRNFLKQIKVGIPMLIFCVLFLFMSIDFTKNSNFNSFSYVLYWIFVYFIGAGFIEELVTRGIILNIFWKNYGCDNKKKIIISCLLSAFLFGMMHVMNMLGTGNIPIAQMIITTGMGLVLSAIYARTKNFYLVAFLHGLWDFCVSIDEVLFVSEPIVKVPINYANQLIIGLVFIIPLVLTFLFLLRKKRISECYIKSLTK